MVYGKREVQEPRRGGRCHLLGCVTSLLLWTETQGIRQKIVVCMLKEGLCHNLEGRQAATAPGEVSAICGCQNKCPGHFQVYYNGD